MEYGAMPSLLKNTTVLSAGAVRPNPNPEDPTSLSLAYGDRMMPKLRLALASPELAVRQRALVSLKALLLNPDAAAAALHADTVAGLGASLNDADELVRATAAQCCAAVALLAAGKVALAASGVLPLLAEVADDDKRSVRAAALHALAAQASDPDGAHSVLAAGLVPLLVDKAAVEEEPLQILALDALTGCVREDAADALRVGAMDVGVALLAHESGDVRARAALLILALATPFEGKILAIDAGAVPALVAALCDNDHLAVQPAAARALMAITVYNGGKVAALDAGAPSILSDIIVSDLEPDADADAAIAHAIALGSGALPIPQAHHLRQLRIASLKAVTTIAEHPLGRRAFLPLVDRLQQLAETDDALVARSAQIALSVIQFIP